MATLLGGHPALPYTTFTENAEKYRNMPSMVRVLNDSGYHTSFYFGGELNYGNLRAYGLFNRFAKIVEERDLDPDLPRGRLGVHDEYLYAFHLREMEEVTRPFFSIIFTMSSHSPYDFPMEPVIEWAGTFNPFLNSVYYADRCLGEYFEMARKQPWYDSTLFILMADHGHASHKNWRYESYEYHRVPLLFYGEVLRDEYRGAKTGRISDNSALPGTLLNQLNMPSEDFRWSVDLFNPYSPEYAYMVLKNGYAWKTRDGEIVYSFKWQHFYKKQFPEGTSRAQEDEFIRTGKSYVQELFREFLAM
jgi:phosphoglycerol transferase MdoB-like AlkP superfamily enzyme